LILLSEEGVTKDDLLERRKLRRRVGEVERLDKEEVRSRDVLGRGPRAELDDVSGRREDRSWRSWSDGGVSEEEGVKMWEDEERVYCPRQRDSFEESDVVDAQGLEVGTDLRKIVEPPIFVVETSCLTDEQAYVKELRSKG